MAPSKPNDVSQQKSPAEFFAENRNIAGFDNVSCLFLAKVLNLKLRPWLFAIHNLCCMLQPGKCLYTTVRELVENSLDSAESINELPDISITM